MQESGAVSVDADQKKQALKECTLDIIYTVQNRAMSIAHGDCLLGLKNPRYHKSWSLSASSVQTS